MLQTPVLAHCVLHCTARQLWSVHLGTHRVPIISTNQNAAFETVTNQDEFFAALILDGTISITIKVIVSNYFYTR